jgi:N-acetylglucosaminyldiphosphoundecaprenol N-acetyl-beta-D-mannosaminyltransferase
VQDLPPLQAGPPVLVGSIPVHSVTLEQTLGFFSETVESGRKALVYYANAHAANLASGDPRLAACFRRADLVFCDGKSVQWASRWLDRPLPERFTPPDWIDRLCELCAARSWRLFLLGGKPGVSEAAARILRDRHAGLEVGAHHGYFQKRGEDNQRVLTEINQFGPQVLLVGFGIPHQEFWLEDNLPHLNTNIGMAIGAMLDSLTGRIPRGPEWLTDSGFEWLTRLVREPRRLGARYLIGNPRFISLILAQKWRQRTHRESSGHHRKADSP